jgi:hypothetical protein
MKATSAIPPPTAPPTIAPKLGVVEGAVVGDGVVLVLVLVGVLVEPEVSEGVGVTESEDIVGVLEANAPTPDSVGVGSITGVVVTNLAAMLNEVKSAWLGGLITPTIPTLQWNDGFVTAQKYQMGALTLVTSRFHTMRGCELLGPNPKNPLWNPPSRGKQGS